MSASPRPPSADQRNSALASHPVVHTQTMPLNNRMASPNVQQIPVHLQGKIPPAASGAHLGSMPYLPSAVHHGAPVATAQANTLGHLSPGWQRPRGSLPGFNVPHNMVCWILQNFSDLYINFDRNNELEISQNKFDFTLLRILFGYFVTLVDLRSLYLHDPIENS